MYGSCHTFEWAMRHTWMKSHHAYECDMPHILPSHDVVMTHICMCHATHMDRIFRSLAISLAPSRSLFRSLSLSLSLIHTYARGTNGQGKASLSLSLSLSPSLSLARSLLLALSLFLSFYHSLTRSLAFFLSLSLARSLVCAPARALSHTYTRRANEELKEAALCSTVNTRMWVHEFSMLLDSFSGETELFLQERLRFFAEEISGLLREKWGSFTGMSEKRRPCACMKTPCSWMCVHAGECAVMPFRRRDRVQATHVLQ